MNVAAISPQIVLLVAGWTSGISLYLTVAILGVSGKAGWIGLPGDLNVLTNPLIILAAIVLFAVEFLADKIAYVDSIWDSFHTFIRPLGAASMGALAGNEHGPMIQTMYALFAGTFALDAHALKASTRLAVNTSPEPFSNVAVSLTENAFVLFIFWFLVKHPILAALIVLALLVLSFFILYLLWKFFSGIFRWIFPQKKTSVTSVAKK